MHYAFITTYAWNEDDMTDEPKPEETKSDPTQTDAGDVMSRTIEAMAAVTIAAENLDATKKRKRWTLAEDEPTIDVDGKEVPLYDAERIMRVREIKDVIRHRAVFEGQNTHAIELGVKNSAAFERNVIAQEKQAIALERIADALSRHPDLKA